MWSGAGTHALTPGRLRVDPGEVGVVAAGPAAGSALADVLVGLARPLRGAVLLHGSPVTGRPAGQCPVALVPCDGGLLPQLTVEGNVGFGLAGRVSRLARQQRVREALSRLQLESVRRLRPHEISPVQRLRTAVARALCAPVAPGAVVVEDRRGQFPCRAAVMTAAAQDLAVLVISDDVQRAEALGAVTQAACQLVHGSADASRGTARQPAVL